MNDYRKGIIHGLLVIVAILFVLHYVMLTKIVAADHGAIVQIAKYLQSLQQQRPAPQVQRPQPPRPSGAEKVHEPDVKPN